MTLTLYERLGGDAAVKMAVSLFFGKICDDKTLAPFFEDVSVFALEVHQVKLLKVLFGPDEEKPHRKEFLDFMLATHTRLFRDEGLDETHFDGVIESFVQTLRDLQVKQDMIEECLES